MNRKNKPNIFLCAALGLLCLVLITTHFSSGMLARFVTRSSGHDSARAAASAVEALLEPASANSYQISIQNKSETAVSCSVQIKLSEPRVGLIRSVTLDGAEKPVSADGTVLFENVCALAPSGTVSGLALALSTDPAALGAAVNQPDFSNDAVASEQLEQPFELRVIYTQID